MKPASRTLLVVALLLAPLAGLAQSRHGSDDIRKDVQRHRAMAAAHEAAARCLESGKPYETCQRELQSACKGLAIGRYCGMRHEH
ncbi:hypothetical protein JI739_20245 [Ramlibacter sp. AW1]|uniref:Uncharacterized protein n=1 Tax=Ramlibacter aurantiacus TaxID=2801330 RepID=A0A937D922_9BURK|nr:hypothetical protein [Ramlibacter aurantiacus]MBL0422676.1 hypothetical protein [Ramlibacter aurantiacus]